jgi:hypothetical protein
MFLLSNVYEEPEPQGTRRGREKNIRHIQVIMPYC